MAGWWDSIFGPSTPQPAHPASRGALLGASGSNMPASSNVEDRRQQGPDYAVGMNRAPGAWTQDYWPSDIKGGVDPWSGQKSFNGYDSLVASPLIATGRRASDAPVATGAYSSSFPQNMPSRYLGLPWRGAPDPSYGQSGLPYIPPHLPISPGEPGWAPPTSPPRPTPGLTLNSDPWGGQ